MNESWQKKMSQALIKNLGILTSKFRIDQRQESKEIDVSQFRMMFYNDLYPEASSVKESANPSTDDNDDEEEETEDRREKKKKKISEAGHRTEAFLLAAANLIVDHVLSSFDSSRKIVDRDWLERGHESGQFNESIFHVGDEAQSLEEILLDLREIFRKCVKTGHARVLNSSTNSLDVISLAGEWLTATANTNMFTYEIAPVFILIEDIILTKMRALIGWSSSCGDGIFAPGAAISDMYALAVARHKLHPDCKTKGMSNCPQLTIFISAQVAADIGV